MNLFLEGAAAEVG